MLRLYRESRFWYVGRTNRDSSSRILPNGPSILGQIALGRPTMAIATINPATGQVIKSFDALSSAAIEAKLQKAIETFATYRHTSFAQRAEWMLKAAAILENEKEAFAKVMTMEMGKTLRSAVDEAAKCAWVCRYYAEHAEKFLADEVVETGAKQSYIRY